MINKLKNDYHTLLCEKEENTGLLREFTRSIKDSESIIEDYKLSIDATNKRIKKLNEQINIINKPKQKEEKINELRSEENTKDVYLSAIKNNEKNINEAQNEYVQISNRQEQIKIQMNNIRLKLEELKYKGALPHQCFKIVEI